MSKLDPEERVFVKPESQEWMSTLLETVFEECRGLRKAGQKEYAHGNMSVFENFDRVAERLGLSREAVLLVYLEKHLDGIHSWVKGHKSQRESVKGRINDAIVYLILLRGMVEVAEAEQAELADPALPLAKVGVPETSSRGILRSMPKLFSKVASGGEVFEVTELQLKAETFTGQALDGERCYFSLRDQSWKEVP